MLSATAVYTFPEVFSIQTLRLQVLPAGAVPAAVLTEHLVGVHPSLNSPRPQPANQANLSSAFLEHLNSAGCWQDQLDNAGVKVLSTWCCAHRGATEPVGEAVSRLALEGSGNGTTLPPCAQGVQGSSVIMSR